MGGDTLRGGLHRIPGSLPPSIRRGRVSRPSEFADTYLAGRGPVPYNAFTGGPPDFHGRLPKAETSRGGYLANRVLRVVDQLSPGARMAAAGFSSQFMEPSS